MPRISNIFGTPSSSDPWGFSLYGHHLCLAITFVGSQMVISPTFFGAEPDVIDEGKHKGLTLFRGEEIDGLRLMQSLRSELQKKAQLYPDASLYAEPVSPEYLMPICRCTASICQKKGSILSTSDTLLAHLEIIGLYRSKDVQSRNFLSQRRRQFCNV